MKLARVYEVLLPYLEGKAGHAATAEALYGDAGGRDAQRLGIYERFCRGHRDAAAGGAHPHLRALVTAQAGAPAWSALVEAYFAAHPMAHAVLNENGAQLAAFLAAREGTPALWAQLADFEWWEWQTLVAPDAEADARPDEGPLRLGSTVELRPYGFDFVGWLDGEGSRAAEPPRREVVVLFWRNRALDARRELATSEELRVLKAVHEGQPVAEDETLADLRQAGIVLGAR